jgi:hypothetical protein
MTSGSAEAVEAVPVVASPFPRVSPGSCTGTYKILIIEGKLDLTASSKIANDL